MMRFSPHATAAVVAALVLAGLLAACGGDNAASSRWTVTVDTLPDGAVHVVNTPPADPEPTWTIREELRIGTVEGGGPASFAQLAGLVVLDDGSMAVLDREAQEVRVFGPDGRHLATHGGKGGGPGEFQSAYGLMRDPEGMLWVPDFQNARMTVLRPTEGFLRSYPLTILSRQFVWQGVMGADGRIFKPSMTLSPPRRDLLRVYDPDMTLLDSLPVPQYPDVRPEDAPNWFYWKSSDGNARGYAPVPFYPNRVETITPQGDLYSTWFADPSYRIRRWTPGGDTTLVLETRRGPVPVGQEKRDSAISVVREYLKQFGAARQDWSKIPEIKPAVLSMFLSDEGRLWVEISSPRQSHVFDVYGPDGRYAGTVVTSLRLYPFLHPVVRGDRFWAVVTDELDVPYVVRGRIVPAGDAT